MRQMQPVLWTKGVLLTPQHMQTQDRYLEDLVAFQLSALTFCPWGFHSLEFDHEELAGGALSISSAAGIFADGLLFDIPSSDAPPKPKQLEGYFGDDQTTLDAYLAIPEYRYGGRNVSASPSDGNTRYLAEVLQRRDENTGLAEKPIQVASKNLRLLVEGESLEGSSVLPAARIIRTSTGDYQLDTHFVPPLVNIAANEYMMAIARRLVEILTAKSSVLAGTRRQRNQSLAEFGVADIANFWLLYTVNTYMPVLRHLFETRQGHPAELFSQMTSLAGALTTFSTNVHPRDLPHYDHGNLSACFTDLDEKLRLLLETVVPANHVSLPMRLVKPSIYATAVEQDRYMRATQWYLAFNADLKQADLLQKAPQLVKLSSADNIERLIKQALPGIDVKHEPNPPTAIPVRLDYQYFRLNLEGPEWEAVRRGRNLSAYVPSDLPNAQLELVLLLPPEEEERKAR